MKQREFVSIGEIKVCKLAQAIVDKTRLFYAHRRLFFSRQKRVKNRFIKNIWRKARFQRLAGFSLLGEIIFQMGDLLSEETNISELLLHSLKYLLCQIF